MTGSALQRWELRGHRYHFKGEESEEGWWNYCPGQGWADDGKRFAIYSSAVRCVSKIKFQRGESEGGGGNIASVKDGRMTGSAFSAGRSVGKKKLQRGRVWEGVAQLSPLHRMGGFPFPVFFLLFVFMLISMDVFF